MRALPIYLAAAVAEIAGCFAFWACWRLGLVARAGPLSLAAFGRLLALAPVEHAGRAHAIYGGVYITASLGWLCAVEGFRPDRRNLVGAAVCLAGVAIIYLGPRG
jgi:small multidrug resistance family-3 protein